MDSPTTLKSSPPAESYLNLTENNSKFEFPCCSSPTENNNTLVTVGVSENSNQENDITNSTKHIINKNEENIVNDNQNRLSNKRKKRNDRKSISSDSPVKLLESDEKVLQNRRSKDVIHDSIINEKFECRQNRKYSILTNDGSIKNFVSESSEEFKKTNENFNKENIVKKKSGNRRSSDCPQRHRRVSIVQGESLRHFIFEEPDTSKMKPNKQRKVSMVPEDTTRNILLEDIYKRKSSMVPGDTLRNLLGDETGRKSSIVPDDKPRKFSINTLGNF